MDDIGYLLASSWQAQLTLAALLGLIPAYLGYRKGASFWAWWVFGTLLLIVALPAVFFVKKQPAVLRKRRMAQEGLKPCPSCAELVSRDAKICRYCQQPIQAVPDANLQYRSAT